MEQENYHCPFVNIKNCRYSTGVDECRYEIAGICHHSLAVEKMNYINLEEGEDKHVGN